MIDVELSSKIDEEYILALIMDAKSRDIVGDVFAKITPDLFFFEGHQHLYNLLFDCYMAGEETTFFSVSEKHRPELEEIGKELKEGIVNISLAFQRSQYTKQFLSQSEDVVGIIAEKLKAKKEMRHLNEISIRINNGLEKGESPKETYDAIEKLLLQNHSSSSKRSYLSPKDMANLMVEVAANRMDKDKREKEIMYTSYGQLNYASGGFEKGNLIILSAGSGVGKSAFSMNMVRDVAYVNHKPVLYLNSEMTDEQQAMRYDALLGQVSHQNIRGGTISAEDFNQITIAADGFKDQQIHTITIPDMQLTHVLAEIKRMKTKAKIEFVVVDYIGRMDITKSFGKDMQEWQIMEQTARELKNLALELGIVIVMVAQLSGNGQTLAKGSSMKNECDLWLNLKRITNDDIQEYEEVTGNAFNRWWNVMMEFRKARSAQFGSKIFMHFCGERLLFTDNEEEAQEMAEKGL